jgi:hypothetical protein
MEHETTSPLSSFSYVSRSRISTPIYSLSSDAIHVWLVLNKAFQAITSHAIQHAGLGDSDFRVLEVFFYKGPLPVNTIEFGLL